MAHRKSTLLALTVSLLASFTAGAEMIQPGTSEANVALAPVVTAEVLPTLTTDLADRDTRFDYAGDHHGDRDGDHDGDHEGDHWWHGGHHDPKPTPLPGALLLLFCGVAFLLVLDRRPGRTLPGRAVAGADERRMLQSIPTNGGSEPTASIPTSASRY